MRLRKRQAPTKEQSFQLRLHIDHAYIRSSTRIRVSPLQKRRASRLAGRWRLRNIVYSPKTSHFRLGVHTATTHPKKKHAGSSLTDQGAQQGPLVCPESVSLAVVSPDNQLAQWEFRQSHSRASPRKMTKNSDPDRVSHTYTLRKEAKKSLVLLTTV